MAEVLVCMSKHPPSLPNFDDMVNEVAVCLTTPNPYFSSRYHITLYLQYRRNQHHPKPKRTHGTNAMPQAPPMQMICQR